MSSLLISCSNNQLRAQFPIVQSKSTKAIIIIEGFVKQQEKIKLGEGVFAISQPVVLNIWDKFKRTQIKASQLKSQDTLEIIPVGELIMVQNLFLGIASIEYFIKAGDTLKIEYNNGNPKGKIINHKKNNYDIDISERLRAINRGDNAIYTAYEAYLFPPLSLSLYDKNFFSKVESNKLIAYNKSKILFKREVDSLKSFRSKNLISEEIFLMFSNRAYYLLNLMELQQNNISDEAIQNLVNNKFNFEGMPYSFLHAFLEAYVEKKIIPSTKMVKYSNGSFPDFRLVYEKIDKNETLFKGIHKDLILFKYLKLINDNFSTQDFNIYSKRFLSKVQNPFLKNQLYDNYFLEFDETRLMSNNDYLINLKKEKITLKKVLDDNRGKLVFIDFWASWCLPCRDAMPVSRKLREKYSKNNITFIYISIDKDFNGWNQAAIAEGLSSYKNSYLSINFTTSDYFNSLKIKSIPRYLLYDFNGNLEWSQAPGPGSIELQNIIDQLLMRGK